MQNIISLITYLFVLLFSALTLSRRYQRVQIATLLGILLPIVFAACRYGVGTDFWTYEHIFERVAKAPLGDFVKGLFQETNPLFMILCRYTYRLGGRVLTWGVLATLIYVPVVILCKKHYPNMSQGTAIAVFLLTGFVSSFNVCREYVAITLVFCSIRFVHENKPLRFMLLILIAFLFHWSAFIALLLWFLWDHRKNCVISIDKQMIFVLGTFFVVLSYRRTILLAAKVFPWLESYAKYYSSEILANNRDFFVSLLVLVFVFCILRSVRAMDKRSDFFFLLLVMGTLIGLTGFTHPQFKRVALYFTVPANVYFAGYAPKCFRQRQELLGSGLIIGFYVGLFVLTYYVLGQSNIIPYRFHLFGSVN